ncbi:MAG: hypothetical protein LBK67_11955 [Coriobacteriales bacterium]|jgi:hypothetical protein|nr:hypothetical protein [Coriobacteriales bacterium]
MSTNVDRNRDNKTSTKPREIQGSDLSDVKILGQDTNEGIDWTPRQNTVETSPEPSETTPDEPEAVPNTGVAAEESPNRYIVVQPPDDYDDSEATEDLPGFAILLLIVLAVAVAVACFHIMKKASKVKANRHPPINQSTSKIEQGYRAPAADVSLTERDRIENYTKKYDIPIEEFYPDSLVHRRKPKKKGTSEADGKPPPPPKMKPPLSY